MEQPIVEPEQPAKPDKPTRPKRRPDPAGQAWHGEAGQRWARAEELVPEDPLSVYEPLPLPSWTAPGHVKCQLFGRYLAERDTRVVHDVENAVESCAIDAISDGTFYHFESELPDELVDCACMGA